MSTMGWIRAWLGVFITGLVVSGLTAFPLVTEIRLLADLLHWLPAAPDGLVAWVERVRDGLTVTARDYPFVAYGTDWLAFAHLVIAAAFWAPWRDPVRNVWVVEWGMICCAGIVPLALIAGPVRGLPFGWTLIDISFGVVGVVPLIVVRSLIKRLATAGVRQDEQVQAGDHEHGQREQRHVGDPDDRVLLGEGDERQDDGRGEDGRGPAVDAADAILPGHEQTLTTGTRLGLLDS
ncbi:hypothetical protein [Actinoplanes sp. CA-252034]|uniref:hypothetical protein n=1 Tax=Actinoplanes sp. CA-252034 TaxID=3239906 RepID=UPI003D96D0B7